MSTPTTQRCAACHRAAQPARTHPAGSVAGRPRGRTRRTATAWRNITNPVRTMSNMTEAPSRATSTINSVQPTARAPVSMTKPRTRSLTAARAASATPAIGIRTARRVSPSSVARTSRAKWRPVTARTPVNHTRIRPRREGAERCRRADQDQHGEERRRPRHEIAWRDPQTVDAEEPDGFGGPAPCRREARDLQRHLDARQPCTVRRSPLEHVVDDTVRERVHGRWRPTHVESGEHGRGVREEETIGRGHQHAAVPGLSIGGAPLDGAQHEPPVPELYVQPGRTLWVAVEVRDVFPILDSSPTAVDVDRGGPAVTGVPEQTRTGPIASFVSAVGRPQLRRLPPPRRDAQRGRPLNVHRSVVHLDVDDELHLDAERPAGARARGRFQPVARDGCHDLVGRRRDGPLVAIDREAGGIVPPQRRTECRHCHGRAGERPRRHAEHDAASRCSTLSARHRGRGDRARPCGADATRRGLRPHGAPAADVPDRRAVSRRPGTTTAGSPVACPP